MSVSRMVAPSPAEIVVPVVAGPAPTAASSEAPPDGIARAMAAMKISDPRISLRCRLLQHLPAPVTHAAPTSGQATWSDGQMVGWHGVFGVVAAPGKAPDAFGDVISETRNLDRQPVYRLDRGFGHQ